VIVIWKKLNKEEGREMEKPVEKISLSKCKSVLESDGSKYTDEEVLQIRDYLYMLAEIEHEVYMRKRIREKEFEKEQQEEYKQAA
jgi:hypothetical protein